MSERIPLGLAISIKSYKEQLYGYEEDPYEKLKNREWADLQAIDHKHLHNILSEWDHTGKPPPEELILPLFYDLELAMQGHPSTLFRRPDGITKPLKHPMAKWMEENAVLYILCCQEYKWDDSPIKTVSEVCKVHRSSVFRWVNEYEYRVDCFVDQSTKEDMRETLEALKSYPKYKHK